MLPTPTMEARGKVWEVLSKPVVHTSSSGNLGWHFLTWETVSTSELEGVWSLRCVWAGGRKCRFLCGIALASAGGWEVLAQKTNPEKEWACDVPESTMVVCWAGSHPCTRHGVWRERNLKGGSSPFGRP
jgi:hypothetical protein